MKKIYLFAASLAMTFGMSSCGIDDVENYGEIPAGNFPVTQEDADAAIAGVYNTLNDVMHDPQISSFIYNALLASDDMLGGGGENDKLMQALDAINHRYGLKTLRLAVEGEEKQAWKVKCEHRSPNYLTDIRDILVVG